MSLPSGLRAPYDPRRVFRFNLPQFSLGGKGRDIGTYIAGGLVSLDREELPTDVPASSVWALSAMFI